MAVKSQNDSITNENSCSLFTITLRHNQHLIHFAIITFWKHRMEIWSFNLSNEYFLQKLEIN
jgi:hypothetical protein